MHTEQELIARWDSFLKKIEARFNESLKQAEEACLSQLVETDYDYFTVQKTWMGIKSQIYNLIQKIDTTWHDKVEPEMRALGDFWTDESFKASELNDKLSIELDTFQTLLEGKIAKAFYDHAITISNKDFSCTQCNAKLEIVKDLFRSQYLTCQYCQAVNTFEPETKYLQIGWGIIESIIKVECLPEYEVMEKALEAIHQLRHPVKDKALEETLWQNYKMLYFDYHRKFFKRRIEMKSDEEKRYDEDMKRKELEFNEYEQVHRYNKYSIN